MIEYCTGLSASYGIALDSQGRLFVAGGGGAQGNVLVSLCPLAAALPPSSPLWSGPEEPTGAL